VKNSLTPILVSPPVKPDQTNQSTRSLKPLSTLLIGDRRVPSPLLRTKDNVVHVGLSQPSVPLQVSQSTKERDSKTSLNHNSLTVQAAMVTTIVTVVLWTSPLPMSEITVSSTKMNTNIPPEREPVLKTQVPSRSANSLISPMIATP